VNPASETFSWVEQRRVSSAADLALGASSDRERKEFACVDGIAEEIGAVPFFSSDRTLKVDAGTAGDPQTTCIDLDALAPQIRALQRVHVKRHSEPGMRRTTLIDENGHLVTVKAPSDQPANDPKEDAHHDFVTDHWMDVAAASYLGFKRYGIGAVIVTERDPMDAPVHETIGTRKLLYSRAERSWIDQQKERMPDEWLDTRFQSYDPKVTVIAVMVDGDGSIRVYAVDGTPNPPRSYELVQARNN